MFKKNCKTILLAVSMTMTFGVANADLAQDPLWLAEARGDQNTSSGQSGPSSSGAGMSGGRSDSTTQSGASGASGAAKSQTQAGAGAGKAPPAPPIILLVPIDVVGTNSAIKKGCWTRIYDRENYVGDSLTVIGPAALADMTGPYGLNWDDRVNSIETGPNATVMVYDNEDFRDPVAQFKPGQRVPDLSKRLGFFDEFASIRVECKTG